MAKHYLKKQTKVKRSYAFLLTIAALFTVSVTGAAVSGKDTATITCNGPWKFKTGDHPEWSRPDLDDADWELVDLSAPPGARDGDVGYSGYVPGWTAKGHNNYFGFAWYRIKISLDTVKGAQLAIACPPAVDDAYQLFINGALLGSAGDFSKPEPVAYSVQPLLFLLPDSIRNKKQVTIAFRVWMSKATLSQLPDAGGIHIAPVLGEKSSVAAIYQFQWDQIIKGYIAEVILPAIFLLLALLIFIFYKPGKQYQWFVFALILLALVRANQAVFYWFQVESAHAFDIITPVILVPLTLGSWLMAWWNWHKLEQPVWIPRIIAVLTLLYMCSQLLGLPWIAGSVSHTIFSTASNTIRLLFVLLLLYIIYRGIRQHTEDKWLVLLATLLVATGLFAQELSALHIQGIWFPFGVGVSRSQYAYLAFDSIMFLILIRHYRRQKHY